MTGDSMDAWHLDDDTAVRYAGGDLPALTAASVDAHLPTCAACRSLVAAAMDPERLATVWSEVAGGMAAAGQLTPTAVRAWPLAGLRGLPVGILMLAVLVLAGSTVRIATTGNVASRVHVAAPSETPTATATPTATPDPDARPTEPSHSPSPEPTTPPPSTPTQPTTSPTPDATPTGNVQAAGTTIVAFGSCTVLLDHLRAQGEAHVTAWGLPGASIPRPVPGPDAAPPQAPVPEAAPPQAADAPAGQPSGANAAKASDTNTQEAGVDEPDLLENDGTHAYVSVGTHLEVVAVADGTPRKVGRVDLGAPGTTLLQHGHRILALSHDWEHGTTIVQLVDVGDPAALAVVHRVDVDGWLVDARSVDGIARVVVRTEPTRLPFVYPDQQRTEEEALAQNRAIVRDSSLDQWLPRAHPPAGVSGPSAQLASCERTTTPSAFGGFGSMSVLTVDIAGDLADLQATSVLTAGTTVYASAQTLYVGTTRWWNPETQAPEQDYLTDLHAFDINGNGPATYLASGSVPGHMLNQFAMSEHDGHLRVATTEGPPFGEGRLSSVYVLQRAGDRLVPVGSVGGMGEGEQIYAVRFMADVGYVVTFRQVDPLYTLDLRDPANPRVIGELKIPGFSSYLHPAGSGRLLGLGQDATEAGVTEGTQLSLFDVSDLAAPRQQSKLVFGGGGSAAEWDHHAFLYWEPAALVVVPLTTHRWDDETETEDWWSGAVAVHVQDGELVEAGRIEHPIHEERPWEGGIQRSFVAGGAMFTVSDLGVQANDLTTLEVRGWEPFDQ